MARFLVDGVTIFAEQFHEEGARTIVLLHGFTGSTKTWQHIVPQLENFHVVTVDLVGHGQTDAPAAVAEYSMDRQIALLEGLFEQLGLKRFLLLGYSMGGRVALSYAARYPERIEQLLLESASPGLVEETERAARKAADDALAEKIIANGIESFTNKWENIPLFETQKKLRETVQRDIRLERLSQREIGLANSLRGMGTGVMPSVWQELAKLGFPVTLLTGSLDVKFEKLAQKMLAILPNAQHLSIIGAGHAIHVENPVKFATIVKETISKDHMSS